MIVSFEDLASRFISRNLDLKVIFVWFLLKLVSRKAVLKYSLRT